MTTPNSRLNRPPDHRQFLVSFRPQDNAGPGWQHFTRRFEYRDPAAGKYRDAFNKSRNGEPPFLQLTVVPREVEPPGPSDA